MKLIQKIFEDKPDQNDKPQPPTTVPVGAPAPNFELRSSSEEHVALSDYRGRPVILAFYPSDWSPVCGDQMVLYNEVLPLFAEHNAQLLGISVDNYWSHKAYADRHNLEFPLLSDFEPKGAVASAYGVYDNVKGVSERALFVIDAQGIIRWSHVSASSVNPGAHGILTALEAMGS